MTPTQWVVLWSDSSVGTLAWIIVTIIISLLWAAARKILVHRDTAIAPTSIYGGVEPSVYKVKVGPREREREGERREER